MLCVDVTHAIRYFFDATNLEALPLFDDLDKVPCLHQRVVGTCI